MYDTPEEKLQGYCEFLEPRRPGITKVILDVRNRFPHLDVDEVVMTAKEWYANE